jgi:hypothetical protein
VAGSKCFWTLGIAGYTKLGMSGVTGTRMGRSPAEIYTLEPFPVYSVLRTRVRSSVLRVGVSFYCMRLIDPDSFANSWWFPKLYLCLPLLFVVIVSWV